jgi:CDP-paratose 2-epimerase
MSICIVTGSGGLIGSETVRQFSEKFDLIIGIDNDMRSYFFGENSSVKESISELRKIPNYQHFETDIRNYDRLQKIFEWHGDKIQMVVHTAAQPSHDWAMKEPLTDFSVNATGTLNLLELTRLFCPKATFVFTSTNKVYGDRPNYLPLEEEETRYQSYETVEFWPDDPVSRKPGRGVPTFYERKKLISETMSIDNTKHSVFGASKVAADIMVQEYGKYFGMNTVCFRGGCLTGPNHQGAELHGFLSYLVKCIVHNKPYTIFGYKGKQVRDNIHSSDLVSMFWHYHLNPRPGEVYNAGGGMENSVSMLEAIEKTNRICQQIVPEWTEWKNYTVSPENRIGDHIYYVSDLSKFKQHYPEWPGVTISLTDILTQIVNHELSLR